MSEDSTQPTLKTILDAVNALRAQIRQARMEFNKRTERPEDRLDRIESMALETRADMRELKAEFYEFRSQFKQPA